MDRVVLLAVLLSLKLLCGVSLRNSAEISHHHINKERHLADQFSEVIDIDCGCDPEAIPPGYVSDTSFIDTGKNMYIDPQYSLIGLNPVLRTVRSFPNGERNCYTLNPSGGRNKSYLIQLAFMYGNYDQENHIPIFDIYLGVDFLSTVNLNNGTPRIVLFELIYKPMTDFIYICLVNIGQGTPFISDLVLRPLKSSTLYESNLGALVTWLRYHFLYFAPDNGQCDRYVDDLYGRLWSPIPFYFQEYWKNSSLGKEVPNLINDEYEIPTSILKSWVEPRPGINSLTWGHVPPRYRTNVYYFYWHFSENEKLGEGELREFMIYMVGNITLGPIRPSHLKALTVVSPPFTIGPGDSSIWFSIVQTNASTLPPILNAFEFMGVLNVSNVATNPNDVKAIMDVKRSYSFITGWQGDPCLPKVPWDGLICSSNNNDPPTITSLNLSSKGLTGEILPSLSGLTSLVDLDLSHNNLLGVIPNFLATMPSLKVLNLKGNNFSGPVPVSLMDKVKNNALSLSFDDNPDICPLNSCVVTKSKRHHILAPLIASFAFLIVILFATVVFCTTRWRKKVALTTSDGQMKLKNRKFTYSEVVSMTNNFQRVIGKGACGTVYHGSLEDGTEVAIKMLNHPSALTSFQTEAELLMRVHHRNLVSLIGYCNEGDSMALIYEYMANGNLQEHLSGEKAETSTPSWKERLQIAIDGAQGLDYLHNGCKPAIVHRDMKTANILLDSKLQARIADFGVSKIFASESATHIFTDRVVGTLGYLDPEYQVSCRLNEKSDVYSFGVILLELITGKPAVIKGEADSIHISEWVTPLLERVEIHSILDQRLGTNFSVNSAWKFLEIAMSCVPPVGIQRPTMAQVLADLKDCLALELVHEKAINGLDVQPPVSSNHSNFDGIQVDSEANMEPGAR